jgi:hypothetical protein
MPFEGKELSPAARLDEEEHGAFMEKCAKDLTASEPPKGQPTPPPAPRYVTEEQLGRLLEKVGRAIKQELDRRIAELEAKQLKLGGVWKAGQSYGENTLVTYAGGLWISRAPTEARPGNGSPSWRLAVKSGDGKCR